MKYFLVFLVLIIGEIVSFFIFKFIKNKLGPPQTSPTLKGSVFRGTFERLVLLIGLLNSYPQILIAFGALKIGTRLHNEKENKISNDYFLVGNLASILIAMFYAIISKNILGT